MDELKERLIKDFSLEEEQWHEIERCLEEVRLDKNEFFIQQGKVCRRTGFILEGVMQYFEVDAAGNEPTCFFTYEGHFIVDPFTYDEQKPAVANLRSITACKLVVLTYENDRKLSALIPRWREIKSALTLKQSLEFADQKAIVHLSAAERYDYFIRTYPNLALRVPLQFIASYLGIAQPSLSRLRRDLVKHK